MALPGLLAAIIRGRQGDADPRWRRIVRRLLAADALWPWPALEERVRAMAESGKLDETDLDRRFGLRPYIIDAIGQVVLACRRAEVEGHRDSYWPAGPTSAAPAPGQHHP